MDLFSIIFDLYFSYYGYSFQSVILFSDQNGFSIYNQIHYFTVHYPTLIEFSKSL